MAYKLYKVVWLSTFSAASHEDAAALAKEHIKQGRFKFCVAELHNTGKNKDDVGEMKLIDLSEEPCQPTTT